MTSRLRSWVLDGGVAAGAIVAEISLMLDDGHAVSAWAVAAAVASGLVLLARRRAPLVVLAVTLAGGVALAAADESPAGVPALAALFTTAERCSLRVALGALLVTAPALALAAIVSVPPTVVVWGVGRFVQTQVRYRQALEERALRLEREREQLAQIAVHEERAAIARELHDIVAHTVSVMLHGVRGAKDVMRRDPDLAEVTLGRAESSGRQSMVELRRILALLRDPDADAEERPQPSLADLGELVREYDGAGLAVRLEVAGERRPLSDGVELSVYRIVQEALTNVLKHAAADRATVTLTFGARGLEVEVVDDAAPRPTAAASATTGHGIVGMRERVALLGGELHAGHRPGGGFRVAARLPLQRGA